MYFFLLFLVVVVCFCLVGFFVLFFGGFCFVLFLRVGLSLYGLGCSGTHVVYQAGLEIREIHMSPLPPSNAGTKAYTKCEALFIIFDKKFSVLSVVQRS